ncbi:MAG: DUF1080 domain-containing protein [Bryobacterales bacterium]|nr:DUF1080 domain-containing protein [Bryobacterales bacterium]
MRIAFFARSLAACALLALPIAAQQACDPEWVDLLKPGLEKWEVLGEGKWAIGPDGAVTGYRDEDFNRLRQLAPFDYTMVRGWVLAQGWLYTTRDYENYDLSLEYWVRAPGNSGISIRDQTRAACGIKIPPDFSCTPSKTGYEIQINSDWPDKWVSGSIYTLANAKEGAQKRLEWNRMEIESRKDAIRVKINGELVAEHPGDPKRPLKGPIGLQLHDLTSYSRFRNIKVKEICP